MTYDLVTIVSVYNEQQVLHQAIQMLTSSLTAQFPDLKLLVVIASNGSTDGTNDIARTLEHNLSPRVQLLIVTDKGRGNALKAAVSTYQAKRYLYIDVDLPLELEDLKNFVLELDSGADLVISRRTGYRPKRRRVMTSGLRYLNRLLFGIRISDSQCAVKALSPAAAKTLLDCRQPGFFLDTELIVVSYQRGLTVREIPIHWVERRFPGRVSKVSPQDSVKGILALGTIWRDHPHPESKSVSRPK